MIVRLEGSRFGASIKIPLDSFYREPGRKNVETGGSRELPSASASTYGNGRHDITNGTFGSFPGAACYPRFPASPTIEPVLRIRYTPSKSGSPSSIPNPAVAGCNSNLAQYSNTPTLHHSAWPDSRTRTTTRTKRLVSTSNPATRSTIQRRNMAWAERQRLIYRSRRSRSFPLVRARSCSR
jgi:hypothetical protein